MTLSESRRRLSFLISPVAGFIVIGIGVLVLLGWATDTVALKAISLRFIAMLPVTAVGMIAAGTALTLVSDPTRATKPVARAFVWFALGVGVLSTLERVTGWDLGFDRLLFAESLGRYPYRPLGLMATNSAISFVLAGFALLLISSDHVIWRRVARRLALLGLTISVLALVGHIYGARPLFAVDRAAGMGLLTAIAFTVLHAGVVVARPLDQGVSLLFDDDLASTLVRRLLPATLLLPFAGGLLWILGRERQVFSRETGVALFVVAVIGGLGMLLWRAARALREADRHRNELFASEHAARQAADTANKAKGNFLAVMSHELRTPLNAILGYQSLLRDEISGPITPHQQQFLNRIQRSASHLTELVDQVLTLATVDAGKGVPRPQPVALPNLLEDVSAILAPLASAKQLAFSVSCPADLSVTSDPGSLRQILVNLGGNAIKFTRTGKVDVSARADGDAVVIDVTDTGIGIAEKHLARIFDEFWQAEPPTTRAFGGAGLGLAVAGRLAHQLGATISVQSTPGAGSQFTLRLPQSPSPPSA